MKKTYYIGLDVHKETIAIAYTFFGSRSKAVYHGECAGSNRAAETALRKLAKKLGIKFKERHHTPKHGSWLDIVESEISAVLRIAISDRVDSIELFVSQCAAASKRKNRECITTNWQFKSGDSRIKLKSLYLSFYN